MSILWFVEQSPTPQISLASRFQNDYAVRVFDSAESLLSMASKCYERFLPAVIILCADPVSKLKPVIQNLKETFSESEIIVYFGKPAQSDWQEQGTLTLYNNDYLRLVREICRISVEKQGAARSLVLKFKNMVLNYDKLSLQILPSNGEIALPLKEARLLKMFMEKPNQCLTRDEIRREVWGNIAISARTIDSYISKLRRYLEVGGSLIESVYRGGYVFK